MRQRRRILLVAIGFIVGFVACFGHIPLQAAEPKTGAWSGGGAIGFLGNTPDGTAFATNLNADYFVTPQVSLGPLAQIAATGDLFQFGLSGQAKLWFDLPDLDKRLRLNLQGGIGFLHADLRSSDTSWLIPIGIGLDYAVNEKLSLTSAFLINFTDIHTGRGTDAHIMPGLTFGIRF
jgi:hypothetical protein